MNSAILEKSPIRADGSMTGSRHCKKIMENCCQVEIRFKIEVKSQMKCHGVEYSHSLAI